MDKINRDKIKVLAISYLFPNTEQPNHGIFVFNRLNALSKYADIKVINPIPWSPVHAKLSQYAFMENIPEKTTLGNLEIYHPRFFSIPKYLKSIEALSYHSAVRKVLREDLASFDFDLIDLHWTYPDLPTGFWLSTKYDKPYLVTLRGYEAFHIPDPGVRKNIVRSYLKRADKVIALSEDLKKTSIELGTPENKHHVVRNGVNVDRFTHMPKDEARKKLNIAESERVIISIGRLVKAKGFDLIVDALPEVIKKTGLASIKLYIIGIPDPGDDFSGELKKRIAKLKLENNVVFQGGVPNHELINWYNAADVFCLASRGEGSPNVLTEALACGCPAVASDVGAVSDIISTAPEAAICVPKEDVSGLESGLTTILMSEHNRVKNAQQYSRYNWDWCAESVNQIYLDVLGKANEL